jgi:hypothetical protein
MAVVARGRMVACLPIEQIAGRRKCAQTTGLTHSQAFQFVRVISVCNDVRAANRYSWRSVHRLCGDDVSERRHQSPETYAARF